MFTPPEKEWVPVQLSEFSFGGHLLLTSILQQGAMVAWTAFSLKFGI